VWVWPGGSTQRGWAQSYPQHDKNRVERKFAMRPSRKSTRIPTFAAAEGHARANGSGTLPPARAVRMSPVVVPAPPLELVARMGHGEEDLHVQQFILQLAI
jgi:hypothetical protein